MSRLVGKLILCLFLSGLFSPSALADHITPERTVNNKYTVILLFFSEGEETGLRFLFRDMKSGKNLNYPITYRFTISEERSGKILHESFTEEAKNGLGEFAYQFLWGGFYRVALEFKVVNEPENIYRPDHWTLWVPGPTEKFSQRYPLNLPVIGGFIFLLVAAAIAFFSAWWKRKRGQAPEINFFRIFGSKESEDRRLQIIKKERQKTSPSL